MVLIGVLGLGTLGAHPVGYLLSHPFWLDEAWVAVGTRAPLRDLLWVSFPTPPGWALLLRLPWPGEQGMRLLPLSFHVATVVMACLFTMEVWGSGKRGRLVVGGLAGVIVMLSPWSLMRQDLKQYTADAFVSLLLLWLASRAEKPPDSRKLWTLAVVSVVAALFSWIAMFVAGAIFIGLLAVAISRHDAQAVRGVLLVGASLAAGFGVVYLVLIAPYLGDSLISFWGSFFLTGTPFDVITSMWTRYARVMSVYPTLFTWVAPVFGVLGILAIGRERPGTAISVPALFCFMVGLGLLERYPFLDQRTSHFLLMAFLTVVAIGFGSGANWLLDRNPLRGWAALLSAALIVLAPSIPYLKGEFMPDEDVRVQVRYVENHRSAGDVVLVNSSGSWGLGYYWSGGQLRFARDSSFSVEVTGDGAFVTAQRSPEGVASGLETALRQAGAPGASGRVWVVLSHVLSHDQGNWESAFTLHGVVPDVLDIGSEPLLVINAAPSPEEEASARQAIGGPVGEDRQ